MASPITNKRFSKLQKSQEVQFSQSGNRLSSALIKPPRNKLPPVSDEFKLFSENGIMTIDQCLDFPELKENRKQSNGYLNKSEEISPAENVKVDEIPSPKPKHLLLDEMIDLLPIDCDILNKIGFQENLIVSLKKDDQIDAKSVLIKRRKKLIDPKYLHHIGGMCYSIAKFPETININASSQFSFQGYNAMAQLNSKTDLYLKSMVENRVETFYYDHIKREKSLQTYKDGESITCIRTDLNERHTKKFVTHINVVDLGGSFMMEGVAFFLLRYLVCKNFVGKCEAFSMYITGEICRSMYTFSSKRKAIINGWECNLVKVKRIIIRKDDDPEIVTSIFLDTGHLLKQTWHDFPYVVHINPLLPMPPKIFYSNNMENQWMEDIKLLQMFLDLKKDSLDDIQFNTFNLPDINCCLKDYLVCLLQRQSYREIDFTRTYFESLNNEQGRAVINFINAYQN